MMALAVLLALVALLPSAVQALSAFGQALPPQLQAAAVFGPWLPFSEQVGALRPVPHRELLVRHPMSVDS